ncbi:uncharacterized protein MYCFIDRAFT_82599 [Pseudocercospora fijiensis CIRAD86]|uniref:N-acetylglucosaminylphosphatidylinositol deacetylase n=1 Tax=Pseudocercospora fijiensis (strain CIRAD86) TaxID=383855 RepID=M3B8L0_PSEFD|nr:uncharacterized protein MYCFIDRAFT_82599 [Pseudocercospora fijiensis CIRAD86]EME85662.1 hypothetical protein MYCFIDRAFT_82599 [Pseudocercospora fijiensis CIRAD86]
MNWLLAWQIPVLILSLWIFTAYMTRSFPTLVGKRICLIIAHPDDEAMFFAPTLRALTKPDLGNQFVLICFSSGDADGLGHIRKEELVKSALHLGIKSSDHVVVIEDKNFQDSMTATWDAKLIAQTLTKFFAPNASTTPVATNLETRIDALITFDDRGVSGHPNHISLYHGCVAFLRSLMQGRSGWECPVKLYTLTSTNMVRKYSSVMDAAVTVLACIFKTKERGAYPTPLLMVSLPGDVKKAQEAMTTAHKSQMRWFRWGWIGISRYMVMNDLTKQKGF